MSVTIFPLIFFGEDKGERERGRSSFVPLDYASSLVKPLTLSVQRDVRESFVRVSNVMSDLPAVRMQKSCIYVYPAGRKCGKNSAVCQKLLLWEGKQSCGAVLSRNFCIEGWMRIFPWQE